MRIIPNPIIGGTNSAPTTTMTTPDRNTIFCILL